MLLHQRWIKLDRIVLILLGTIVLAARANAQVPDTLPSPGSLKKLSLEQLMDLEVTSVSKRPEKLSETASAIQVITGDEIRRSGATTLAEALRLVANLQIAQVNASQWAISARGFNNVLANKLLVLIDGRTVYTPLYAGVFWDVQNPPLELIERIEVVSGPGGALWGANAVNGVINIITRKARDTRGAVLAASAGNEVLGAALAGYGGNLGSDIQARVYGEAFGRDNTVLTTGGNPEDAWHMAQGGFRVDRERGADFLTLQGDVYDGRPDPDGSSPVIARGGNAIARWNHSVSERSDFQLQVYYDRTYRDFRNGFTENLATYDVDWQHRFQFGRRQEIVWGIGARFMDHRTTNVPLFEFLPEHRVLHLYNGFLQDDLTLAGGRWHLVLGAKFEHNDYTGSEFQPNVRLAWTPSEHHTIWTAVSRAVRTPARIDRDFRLSLAPGVPFFDKTDFQSEEVVAYELGWRLQPGGGYFLSLSTFYNEYDNIRSAEAAPLGLPILFRNGVNGHSYGAELAGVVQATRHWRLRAGYTFLTKKLSSKPGHTDLNQASAESDDPKHQFVIQSMADLTSRLEMDVVLRYVDALPKPAVPSYFGLDLRLGWHPTARLELSLIGQNLLEDRHPEFIASGPAAREIERSILGKITWR